MTEALLRAAAAPETVRQALAWAAGPLTAAGIENARQDARLLLAAALEVTPEFALARPEHSMSATARARFAALVERRLRREPVSRILGRREFWSLEFKIGPATLDPRPDSETLVEAVLAHVADRAAPITVLDLGTGSGCLLLALLSELPAARGLGVDVDSAALDLAAENARALGLADRARFEATNWAETLVGSWQVILSNPPYIKESDLSGLAPEVALHDPRVALDGGPDGLAAYRVLVPQAATLLAPGGLLALEAGAGQAEAVESIVRAAGLALLGRMRDLAGEERCVLARA